MGHCDLRLITQILSEPQNIALPLFSSRGPLAYVWCGNCGGAEPSGVELAVSLSYSGRMTIIAGLIVSALLSLLSTPFCSAISPISLSSLNWTLHNSNGSISIPAAVPGYALDALHTSGAVGDPLYRYCALPCRLLPFIVTSVSGPTRYHACPCVPYRYMASYDQLFPMCTSSSKPTRCPRRLFAG